MKHLIRLNANVENKINQRCSETWVYQGTIEFEIVLDIKQILILEESVLNGVFKNMVEKQNTEYFRYTYLDFDIIYNFPKKLKQDFNKELKVYLSEKAILF